MLFHAALVLSLAASSLFITEVPAPLRAHLAATNETHGTFVQTKLIHSTGARLVSSGEWRIRPGSDFSWRVTDPFDSLFFATKEKYSYSNEDERVERELKDLPHFMDLGDVAEGDYAAFFKAFDALYKTDEAGCFHVLAKPRDKRLAKVLERVEADGVLTNWTIRATFPSGDVFDIHIAETR